MFSGRQKQAGSRCGQQGAEIWIINIITILSGADWMKAAPQTSICCCHAVPKSVPCPQIVLSLFNVAKHSRVSLCLWNDMALVFMRASEYSSSGESWPDSNYLSPSKLMGISLSKQATQVCDISLIPQPCYEKHTEYRKPHPWLPVSRCVNCTGVK